MIQHILVLLIVTACVAWIVRRIIRQIRGKSDCNSGCGNCPLKKNGGCHNDGCH